MRWDIEGGIFREAPARADQRQRVEDIYFRRGDAALSPFGRTKVRMLARDLEGRALTLYGFVSEDELIDPGPTLADDRLAVVDRELAAQGHDGSTPPSNPLRTLVALPDASVGVINYRTRRKVEVVRPGEQSRTVPCAEGDPRREALTATQLPVVQAALDRAVTYLDTARLLLSTDTPPLPFLPLLFGPFLGSHAFDEFIGDPALRAEVVDKLEQWADHLRRFPLGERGFHGLICDAACGAGAMAYNNDTGSDAEMTFCDSFFEPVYAFTAYGSLSEDEQRAFVVMHEGGHGSIGTVDIAYGFTRLFQFLDDRPEDALRNTDSFARLVLCLNGLRDACDIVENTGPVRGMDDAERTRAMEAVGWVQSWLIWAEQDVSGLYGFFSETREQGNWIDDDHYGNVVRPIFERHFEHRRPHEAPATARELTTVAAVHDRIDRMLAATGTDLTIEKHTDIVVDERWRVRTTSTRGAHLRLTDFFFIIGNLRPQVEHLLELLIEGTPEIQSSLRFEYAEFIKEIIQTNWGNRPP